MTITTHNGREDVNGRHNDRHFDVTKAKHIDPNRVKDDIFWTYNGSLDSFRNVEVDFYKQHFDTYLHNRNEKCVAQKKKDRVLTMEEYSKRAHSRPEDRIMQIGDIYEHATGQELWECVLDYQKRFDEMYGDNCKILDMALHMDEATPHVQLRRVWIAHDKDGNEYVNQGDALAEMGISRPNPNEPEGKRNNAKIPFTQMERELFRQVCIEHGLEIDPDRETKAKHLDTLDYKIQQDEKKLKELEAKTAEKEALVDKSAELNRAVNHMTEYLAYMPYFHGAYTKELEESKNEPLDKRAELVLGIVSSEVEDAMRDRQTYLEFLDQAVAKEDAEKEIAALKQYISETGHTQDYLRFVREHELEERRIKEEERKKREHEAYEGERDYDGDGIADGYEAAADRWSI